MDLPGYIKDFLQMNYYIPAEELALPFDQMPPYLRELITTKCMDLAENGEMSLKNEQEILDETRKQFQSDIDSDITKSQDSQVNNFVAHHQKLTELVAAAEKHEKNLSDFSKTAVLLAAKRMASDEYADTPKTLDNFLQVKEEIATELQVKYFTARYFETHGLNPENADTFHEKRWKTSPSFPKWFKAAGQTRSPPVLICPTPKKRKMQPKGRLCPLQERN